MRRMTHVLASSLALSLVTLATSDAQNDPFRGFRNLFNGGAPQTVEATQVASQLSMLPVPVNASKSAEVLKLLYANQREEAVTTATTHIRSLVDPFLEVDPMKRGVYESEMGFPQFLQVYGLGDDVLGALQPMADPGMEQILPYAAVAEMLERKVDASKGYQAVLTLKSDHDGVRNRLALLAIDLSDQELAKSAVSGMSQSALATFAQVLFNQIQATPENKYERRLDYVEVLVMCFEKVDPKTYVGADWLPMFFDNSIGQGNWGNEIRFGDLYTTSSNSVGYNNDDQRAASEKVAARRMQLHEKLCQALIVLPQFSTIGFQRSSGMATKVEGALPRYQALAHQLLLRQTPVPARPEGLADASNGYRGNFREDWVPFLSPAEFLLAAAIREGDDSLLKESVIPALEKMGKGGTVAFLKDMLVLREAPDPEFIQKAAAVIKQGVPDVAASNLMRRVLEMAEARGGDFDQTPLLMAYFESIRNERYVSPQFVYQHGQAASSEGSQAFTDFIDQAAVAMLGPVEGQAALIEAHYEPNREDLTSPGNAIRNYAAFLGQMIQGPSTAAIPLKKGAALKLVHPNEYFLRNQVQNTLQYYRIRNQGRAVYAFIKEMGFLEDVDTLDFFSMPGISRRTLFGYMLYNVGRMDSDDKQSILSLIDAEPNKTLGRALFVASMNASSGSSSQRTAITNALEPFMDRILKLPEERQKEIRYAYAQMISQNSLNSSTKKSAPKVAAWYEPARQSGEIHASRQQQQANQGYQTLEAFLKAGSRQMIEQNNGLDHTASQVMATFAADATPEQLTPFLEHYFELARQPYPHAPDQIPQPLIATLLSNWIRNGTSLSSLGIATYCFSLDEPSMKAPLGENLVMPFRNLLSGITFESPATASVNYLRASKGHYDPRLTPLFLERFSTLKPPVLKGIQTWAAKESSDIAKAWLAAASLSLEVTAETEAVWTERLQVEDPLLALEAASLVAPVAVRLGAWRVVASACDVFEASWKDDKVFVSSQQASSVLALLLRADATQPEKQRLAKRFLGMWTPHLESTSMGLGLVKQVLDLDASYGVDTVTWLRDLPQTVQRQPGFFIMVLQHASAEQVAAALPWAYLSMPSLPQGMQGRSRRVVRYVNGQRQEYYTSPNSSGTPNLGNAQMDQALWDRLQAFLPKVSDPGARLFAEMLVGGLPDRAAVEGVPIRRERLEKVNAKFDRALFASPELAEHTVSWLCSLNGVTDRTRPAMSHFGDQLDYRLLAKWQDELSTSRQVLLSNYVKDSSKNDPARFAGLLTSMLAEADLQNGEAQQLLETYCQGFPKSVFTNVATMTEEQARSYLPLLKTLGEMSNNVYWNGRDDCMVGNVAMHVLAGQGKEYQEWLEGLDMNTLSNIMSETSMEQVVFLLRDGFQDKEMPEAQRSKLLNDLFVATSIPEAGMRFRGRSSQSVYEQMIELNALKVDEILKYGSEWAEMNPRQGAAYGELAGYQEAAGQKEEAILNYLQAVIHSPRGERARYTSYHLAKTKLLLEMDRVDAAASWVHFFDKGRLDSDQTRAFESLSQMSRRRYLTAPGRLEKRFPELRSQLRQDPKDVKSWQDLAEVMTAMGTEKMEQSDYLGGLAFLKFGFYIFHQLDVKKAEFDKDLFKMTKQELARGLVALGLGGRKQTLISKKSKWHYHYKQGGLPNGSWHWIKYAYDADWQQGIGPFGYGDGDEATILNFGKDKKNKPITAYFRKEFTVSNPQDFDQLSLGVLHDDGMIVYLNNKQLARNNMPSGSRISATTQAPDSRGSSVENEYWETKFPADLLLPGLNVIAVEVHQNDPDSSDLGFDLEISAEAVKTSEVVTDVESGKVLKRLGNWREMMPDGLVETLKTL